MKSKYLPGGFYPNMYVMPFEGGLTYDMAEARNPAAEIQYRSIKQTPLTDTTSYSLNKYYMVQYNNMKVCACVLTCGLNGFDYALLWKQY